MNEDTALVQAQAVLLRAQISEYDWNLLLCIDAASQTARTGTTIEQRSVARRVVRNLSADLIRRYGQQEYLRMRFIQIRERISERELYVEDTTNG